MNALRAVVLPPSIHVIERGWLSSNNIVLRGAHHIALVDTGYISRADQTLALLRHALNEGRLDLIVNTHLHSDHCGGNAVLHAHFGCDIAIPAAEAGAVRDWDEAKLSFRATGQLCERFDFHQTLTPGDSITLGDLDWQGLGAPGHDPHAVMLYSDQTGWLISGDALWHSGFGVIFPELDGLSGFAEQQALLEQIAMLDLRGVIPGHGAPFTDVDAALERAFSRLAYLRADPRRNARNALKVLIMFKLLDARRMRFAEFQQWCTEATVVQRCLRWLDSNAEAALELAVAELVRGGSLRADRQQDCLEAL